MVALRYRIIKGAQTLLRSAGVFVLVDGIWGSKTEAAMVSVPPAKQAEITKFAEDNGVDLNAIRRGVVTADSGIWTSEAAAIALADEASQFANIPKTWLRFALTREPNVRRNELGTQYQVDSISPGGSFRGLFQMGAAAWSDAYKQKGFQFIGSYEPNWKDPRLNAYAAAGYALANKGYARNKHKYAGELTPELMYALHNQGHTFFNQVKKGDLGPDLLGQSKVARADLNKIMRSMRGEA